MAITQKQEKTISPTYLDWQTLELEIDSFGTDADTKATRFQLYILYTLFGLSESEGRYFITDGGNDRGIDCVYINRERKEINFINTKTVSNFKKSRKNFPGAEVDKLSAFMTDFLNKNENTFTDINPRLCRFLNEIWNEFTADYKIILYLASNQAPLPQDALNRLVASLDHPSISIVEFHFPEITRNFHKRIKKPLVRELPFIKKFEHSIKDYKLLVGLVATDQIVKLVSSGTFSDPDPNLFGSNVRFDLGDVELNKTIRNGLITHESEHFACLNNGLTITCDKIISSPGIFPHKIVNPQIVNGCQTVLAILKAFAINSETTFSASVLVKIVQSENIDFADRIAIASNSQNRILPRDLRANDNLQIILAEGIKRLGYFYRRKRGEIYVGPARKEIDSRRCGQLILAFLKASPERAKTKSDAVFDEFYAEIFDPSIITPQLVINLHNFYENLLQKKTISVRQQRALSSSSFDEDWIIEGIYHVIFLVGELYRRNNRAPADENFYYEYSDIAFQIVESYFQRTRKAAYRVFRSVKAKEDLLHELDRFLNNPTEKHSVQLDLDF
jgi:hypothetical protein